MLWDAFFAETYRLARSRTTWFWSVFFVPTLTLVFSVIGAFVQKGLGARMVAEGKAPPELALAMARTHVDVGQAIVNTAGELAGPMTLAFVLIGAATLYAGDYRWETWRLISARNTRDYLILGKVGVLKLLALAAMTVMLIAGIADALVNAFVLGKPLAFTFDGGDFGQFAGYFFLSYLRIMQFMMISLLMAVMTRSLLASLFVPLVVGVAQFFSMQALGSMGVQPEDWIAVMANPGGATDTIKALISGGAAAKSLADGVVLKSVVSLAFWMLVPLVGALAWFRKQDLSKE